MQSLRSHHDKLLCTPLDCSCQAHCSGVRLFGLLDPRMPYQPACSRRRWLQIGGRRLHSAVHAPDSSHKHILYRHAATPPRRHAAMGSKHCTRLIVVGGVAGGMSAATRARRLSDDAIITVFEAGS